MDGCHKENPQPAKEKNGETQSAKINRVAAFVSGSENARKKVNPTEGNPNGSRTSKALDSSAGDTVSVSLKGQGNVKKPSRGSTNFFDRCENLTNINWFA